MKNSIKTLVLVIALSTFSMTLYAANPDGEEDFTTNSDPGDTGGDPGVVPINDYLIPMLVLGFVIGYRLMRKKTEIVR